MSTSHYTPICPNEKTVGNRYTFLNLNIRRQSVGCFIQPPSTSSAKSQWLLRYRACKIRFGGLSHIRAKVLMWTEVRHLNLLTSPVECGVCWAYRRLDDFNAFHLHLASTSSSYSSFQTVLARKICLILGLLLPSSTQPLRSCAPLRYWYFGGGKCLDLMLVQTPLCSAKRSL